MNVETEFVATILDAFDRLKRVRPMNWSEDPLEADAWRRAVAVGAFVG